MQCKCCVLQHIPVKVKSVASTMVVESSSAEDRPFNMHSGCTPCYICLPACRSKERLQGRQFVSGSVRIRQGQGLAWAQQAQTSTKRFGNHANAAATKERKNNMLNCGQSLSRDPCLDDALVARHAGMGA